MSRNDSVLWIRSMRPDPVEEQILAGLASRNPAICGSFAEAAERMATSQPGLLFANFPAHEGTAADLLAGLPSLSGRAPVFIRDPQAGIDDALCLARMGIDHLLGKDAEAEDVLHRIDLCLADQRARFPETTRPPQPGHGMIGSSRAMERVSQLVELVAPRRCTVLITGETGTGKEVAARAIHAASPRAAAPFVAVNCGALPENLLEAELFGHVKGAFTGAQQHRVGRFELANQGTIFLDEIGDMPLELQTKLLRVLQERTFERLGSSETIRVDVRVIAATNVDLAQRVREGGFRQDLFYRLNVVPIPMPPLRARAGDIPALAHHFIQKVCREEGIETKSITQDALRFLMNRDWPGNVRQLENAVEMAVVMSGRRPFLDATEFPSPEPAVYDSPVSLVPVPEHGLDFEKTVSQFERGILSQVLRRTRGNKKQAAELLGLKRTTLSAKVRILEAAGAPLH